MTGSRLDDLAYRYGIVSHQGFVGEKAAETKIAILAAFGVDAGSEAAIEAALDAARDRQPAEMRVHPGTQCHIPPWPGKAWGLAVQLYEIRSRRNWGIGDFEDLAGLCRIAAEAGADFVGINPLHALFLAEPSKCSPFSPSNRLFLDPLYIAVDRLPGYAAAPGEPDLVRELRELDAVDYVGVANVKLAALKRLWRRWATEPLPGLPRAAFDDFQRRLGEALRRHALFETLSARMAADGKGSGWRGWPQPYRDHGSPEVQAFARENEAEIEFHAWLQWIADLQLGAAKHEATRAGMRIGLYLDFAVGEVPDGSASWSGPAAIVPGMRIGAPPDVFSAQGQEWGLAPVSPLGMAQGDLGDFRRAIAALTRHAGALRLDHVMALWQLFFVPEFGVPADGAYVRYPLASQLDVLAELSQQDATVIIGEDLGIVPPGFREVMRESRILSYRILCFEKTQDGAFIAPEDYPWLALACLSTHDLPTLKGWWRGHDIELRLEHGLIDEGAGRWQFEERRRERHALIELMRQSGALEAGTTDNIQAEPDAAAELPPALVVAAHRLIAATPSLLACVRVADLTGESRPTNLPGTVDEYPNWRLKSLVALEELAGLELFREVTEAMAAARPKTA